MRFSEQYEQTKQLSHFAKPYYPQIQNEIWLRRDINQPHNTLVLCGFDCVEGLREHFPDFPTSSNANFLWCEFDQYLQPELYSWPTHGIDAVILTGVETGALERRLKNAALDGYLARTVQTYQYEFGQWHGPIWFSPISTLELAA